MDLLCTERVDNSIFWIYANLAPSFFGANINMKDWDYMEFPWE